MPCSLPFQPDLILSEQTALTYEDPNFYSHNVQLRVLVRDGVTRIGIAGSNDPKDWMQDFEAFMVSRTHGKIFKGFADMTEPAKYAFLAYIKSFPPPYEIGSHSAGGPVALQFARWMAEVGQKPRKVQLLACPVLWDRDGSEYYQSFQIPTLRIANYHDPIASLPGLGGVKESPELVLDSDGVERECQDIPEEWRVAEVALEVAKYHGVGPNYVRAVRGFTRAG